MKFILSKASNYYDREEISITTIEDLLKLMDKYNNDIILSTTYYDENDVVMSEKKYNIVIYDAYIE